jgi:hypothetical protein
MAKINLVDKRARLSLWDTVKFQLITYCYLNKIALSESELDCLTLLSIKGEYDLTDFCNLVSAEKIFKTTQSVRNCLVKMEKTGFVAKEGKNKKKISINTDIKLQAQGNILLDFKFAYIASQES